MNTTLPDDIESEQKVIMHVATCIIISIGLPLTLIAIYALCLLVRKDHVGPIYVINLFISDLFQLCWMIVWGKKRYKATDIEFIIYLCGLATSVSFMVCISLERYLVIAHPLWYRFKRTIKISVVVSVVVWLIPPAFFLIVYPRIPYYVKNMIFAIFLLVPFPLFIFFLVGTLRALSASVSVPYEEKLRIVGILVLVLLIYTLLFLPSTILNLGKGYDRTLADLSLMFLKLSPLADLILYFFMRKQPIGKLFTTANCCRVANTDPNLQTV